MAQCQAITKDGKRCEVSVPEGEKFCHIHLRNKPWQRLFSKRFLEKSLTTSFFVIVLGLAANVTGLLGYFGIAPNRQPTTTPTLSLASTSNPTSMSIPNPASTITPALIPISNPTSTTIPTNGPCIDILDVNFLANSIFPVGEFPESEPVTPSGRYIIISTEIKNLQSNPMPLYWNDDFMIAGQINTSSNDFTYYVPNWSVTWDYAYDNNIVDENCPENLNPGLSYRCDMVFDIDPKLKNLYLMLYNLETEDGKPFNNACTSSWRIPVNQ